MEHLTFEEIVGAIYADAPTPENLKLIGKVNSHVMNCPECYKIHKAVYDLYELGFEGGLDEVYRRINEPELAQSVSEDIAKEERQSDYSANPDATMVLKNYLTQIVLMIENRNKLVLKSMKDLGSLKHYYSYPMAVSTRGGENSVDTGRLVDDENLDNEIIYSDGLLQLQFSKLDFDDNGLSYPFVEILSDDRIIYNGPFDEDGEILKKVVPVNDISKIYVNVWEQDVQQR